VTYVLNSIIITFCTVIILHVVILFSLTNQLNNYLLFVGVDIIQLTYNNKVYISFKYKICTHDGNIVLVCVCIYIYIYAFKHSK